MKTLIAIPCMDKVDTPFMVSMLNLQIDVAANFSVTQATLVYDARNKLARDAIEGGYDRILFFDSDMTFEPDIMKRLEARMDEGYDLVTGLYFTRKAPWTPTIYKRMEYVPQDDLTVLPVAEAFDEFPEDDVFEIKACGFGGCIVSVDLIRKITDKYGLPFSPQPGFGEDLSFCMKAREFGAKMVCDSGIRLGHIMYGIMDEKLWRVKCGG